MEKNAQIVVTGGTGLLGSYLLRYLTEAGYHHITGVKRPNSPMDLIPESIRSNIKWVDADITDIIELEPAIEQADYVFHCAGLVSFLPKDKKELFRVNQEGTANIVNLCLIHGVKKLVYTSSVAAIGRPQKQEIIHEKTKWERHDQLTQYAISKYLGEMEVWRGNAEGLRTVILNPVTILGGGFWHSGPQKLFNLAWQSFPYFSNGKTGFVDVRDVAKIHLLAMQSDIDNQRFILSAENITFKKLMHDIAEALNTTPPHKSINPRLQQLLWRVEKIKSFFRKKAPFLTRETVMMSGQSSEYDNQKSRIAFHFSYHPIEKTISEMAALYKIAQSQNQEFSLLELY